jgi:FixJ family two-component response regulator
MNKPSNLVNVLLVEDDTVYSKMLLYQLSRIDFIDKELNVNHIGSLKELEEIKEFINPELILLDLGLPDSNGPETFRKCREIFPNSAVIILTGNDDDRLASDLVKGGAQDFIFKGDVDNRVLRKSLEFALDRSRINYDSVQIFDESWALFEGSLLSVFLWDINESKVIAINSAMKRLVNDTRDDQLINTLQEQLRMFGMSDFSALENSNVLISIKTCEGHDLNLELTKVCKNREGNSYIFCVRVVSDGKVDGNPNVDVTGSLLEKTALMKSYLMTIDKEYNIDTSRGTDILEQLDHVIKSLKENN